MNKITNLTLSAIAMYALAACSDDAGQGNNNDAGTNQNDSSVEDKLDPINPSTVSPSDSSSYSFSNSIVRPGFTVPDESEGTDGTYDSGITATGDNGTPGDTSDDWSKTLASESAAPGTSLDSRIDLASECGSAGNAACKDGEKVTFNFQAAEETYQVEVSFDAGVAVKYCNIDTNSTESLLVGSCIAQDSQGEFGDGEWEINCDLPGGCNIAPWGEWGSVNGMTSAEVGLHVVSARVRRVGGEWSDWYDMTAPIDYTQAKTVINGLEMALSEVVGRDAGACFDDYEPAQVPQAGSDPNYGVERNTALGDNQSEVTSVYNCVEGVIMEHINDESLRNLNGAEGQTPGERLLDEKVDPETVDQVQVYFGRAIF